MGIIIKQSAKGTFWTYAGVVIGFITTTYLYPNFLSTEVIGLFGLLLSISSISGRIFLLGLPGMTNRMFSYFRDEKSSGHQGFLFIAAIFQLTGIVLFLILYLIFSPKIIELNIEKSPLVSQYAFLLIPLSISYMVFFFWDTYNKMIYDVVSGIFLQEFVQRVVLIIIVASYALQLITLHQLIILYAVTISLKAILIIVLLLIRNEIHIKRDNSILTKELKKEILSVAAYSVLGGVGSILIFNLDKIIIHNQLGLAYTGIYTIAVYFGSIVSKPSQPLLKISSTLIAEAWKKEDLNSIKEIYHKSCLNQLIIGGFIFLGIWLNIDNILIILGEEYNQAKWVIFFIGMGYLFDMLTGANNVIIGLSKYYRISLVFTSLLILLVVFTMFTLIPQWGITGAAVAIMLSIFINNILRFIFLYRKYRLNPFNYKFLVIIGIYMVLYAIISLIPTLPLITDILLRSGLVSLIVFLLFWKIPLSEDINSIIDGGIDYIREKLLRKTNFRTKK